MNSRTSIIFTILLSSLTVGVVQGQQSVNPKSERALRLQTETTAINTLESLTRELREVPDMSARIAMTGEIVKLLGAKRPAVCRQLLDAVFDDALQLLRAAAVDHNSSNQSAARLSIQRIIKIAATFDHKLAQSYLEKSSQEELAANGDENRKASSAAASDANLQFAIELVEKDITLAVSVARRSLASPIRPRMLVFLETLRTKDTQAASSFLFSAAESVKARG